MTKEDFWRAEIPINISLRSYWEAVGDFSSSLRPNLIVFDNLAHLVGGKYSDPELIHRLMTHVYRLVQRYNAAVIIAAHPRKEDRQNRVYLQRQPEAFFEEAMGSSHFINSTGSLWGIERNDSSGYTVFLGGRQRGDGHASYTVLQKGDDDRFTVLPDAARAVDLVINTKARKEAWRLLPDHPQTFGYREGQELVKPAMKSSSSYQRWMRDLRRNEVVLEVDGKLQKAPGIEPDKVF